MIGSYAVGFSGREGLRRRLYRDRCLAALHRVRHLCTRAETVMPHAKVPGSLILIEAIKLAIDDYAEREMGHREYFWERPHKAG